MSLPPDVPQPINRPNTQPEPAGQLQEIEREMTGFERATLRWARVAVIMSALAALFVCLQWWEMHQGGIDTHALAEAAGDTANAASDQADAAQQFSDTAEDINGRMQDTVDQLQSVANNAKAGIRATQEAMRLDQRAWIGLETVTGKPELDKVFEIALALKNTGRTPANKVTVYSVYDPVQTGQSPHFDLIGQPISIGFVSPNAMHAFIIHPSQGQKMTKEYMDATQGHTYFIHGILTYRDIFGIKHWFTWCLSMETSGDRYDYCPNHNDSGDGQPPFDLSKAAKPN